MRLLVQQCDRLGSSQLPYHTVRRESRDRVIPPLPHVNKHGQRVRGVVVRAIVTKTTRRQCRRIALAMLVMTGRVTMLGLSRWAGTGGSDRTVQRFYATGRP